MQHLTPCRFDPRTILSAIFCVLVISLATATGAFAQHAGGHVGGPGHISSPPAAHPGISRPATPIRPPVVGPGTRSFLVRPPYNEVFPTRGWVVGYPYPRRPIRPGRPIYPILPYPGFGAYGNPFFGLGFGWGFGTSLWWACQPLWLWNNGCNGVPYYGYGLQYTPPLAVPNYAQPQMEIQNWPVYYGEPNSQSPQLFLKDGTVYSVTDYWVVNGELHFKTAEENYTKVVEHKIDFDQLDLQKSVDVNTERGFRFVLRNEPLQQYLRDHSDSASPTEPPAESVPPGRMQVPQ